MRRLWNGSTRPTSNPAQILAPAFDHQVEHLPPPFMLKTASITERIGVVLRYCSAG
ncbi:MAG: hypothetical protein WDN69_13235 [Aliidongia sp.]